MVIGVTFLHLRLRISIQGVFLYYSTTTCRIQRAGSENVNISSSKQSAKYQLVSLVSNLAYQRSQLLEECQQ